MPFKNGRGPGIWIFTTPKFQFMFFDKENAENYF